MRETCVNTHAVNERLDVTDLARLHAALGEPPPRPGRSLAEVEEALGVQLPGDYAAFALEYGDTTVDDYLFLYGPATLVRTAQQRGATLGRIAQRLGASPHTILPTAGGMLLWGSTVEGDALFLIDRGERWTVSAFVRQRGQWYQSDQTLMDWLLGALDNDASPPWLPVWEDTHHVTVMSSAA